MNHKHKLLGQVIKGGTVIGLTADSKGRLWALTSVGLFRKDDQGWLSLQWKLPFSQVSTLKGAGKLIFVGAATGNIAYTLDGGDTWSRAWIDQVQSPIACLALSPSYPKDHVLMAGTLGEGILRTTDGGRHWQVENFGLHRFNIFALVSAAVEESFRQLRYIKDYVFAGTDDGVYVSPNGGRAWKIAGEQTAGMVILTLAVSSHFEEDGIVYAGAETGELFRSRNKGGSWERLDLGGISPGAINSLVCLDDGTLLVGTSQAGILRSKDGGLSWEQLLEDVLPVFVLESIGNEVFSGLYQRGLMKSGDGGKSWCEEEDLIAHHFEWLEIPKNDLFLAAGPDEGIWSSVDRGSHWSKLSTGLEGKGVLGIVVEGDMIFVATPDGIWESTNFGQTWKHVLESETMLPSIGVLSGRFQFGIRDDLVWCGGENGQIWHSMDKGQSWQLLEKPFRDNPVIDLAVKKDDEGTVLLVGILDESLGEISLWRSDNSGNWEQWIREKSIWNIVHIIASREGLTSKVILSLGTKVYEEKQSGILGSVLDLEDKPITALAMSPHGTEVAAASFERILYRDGNDVWVPLMDNSQREAVVDLQFSPTFDRDGRIFALTNTGKVWEIHIE